jgi:hypothetical protein
MHLAASSRLTSSSRSRMPRAAACIEITPRRKA